MNSNRRHLISFILIWTVYMGVDHVEGFPTGAPDYPYTCNSLMPDHGALPQMTEMPYDVIVDGTPNNRSYDVTQNHTVIISGKSGSTFKGFILQARKYTTTTDFTTIGSFLTSSDAQATCQTNGGATVTHVNNNPKQSVQVLWIAPSSGTGTVQFRGAIVQEKVIIWQFSPPLPPAPNTTTAVPTLNTTAEPPVPIDTSECGKSKGCYFRNCANPNDANQCEYGLTWSAAGPTETAFELFASATFSPTPYVALGLSKDTFMGDDSVTDCIYSPSTGSVNVQMSFNTGHSNSVLNDKTLSLVNGSTSGSFSNGMLICRFARLTYPPPTNTSSQDKVYYPGTDLYNILIAKGVSSSGIKNQHSFQPTASPTQVNFTRFDIVSDIPPTPPTPDTTGEPPVAIDTVECGKSKGCYFSNCANPNDADQCEYGVTWSSTGPTETSFELFASATFSATPYVALGLSRDTQMGDDSVTDCIYSASTGSVNVQMSYNNDHSNEVLTEKTLGLVNGSSTGSFSGGMLFCRFVRHTYPPPTTDTRSKRQTNQDQVFYPGTDLYNILIAKGSTNNGVKTQHSFQPAASATKFNLTEFVVSSDNPSLSPLIKAHGIMMIFAWMVFASFGILMPRYYKTAWPGKTWGGKAIWFQLHQPLMSITLILTAAAFILIFIEVKGYSELVSPSVAHPPLGIVVMALVIINPVMALFRPDPKADKRWIFNICHFIVGLLAHLSSAVAIFLATYIEKLRFPEWCRWVMVGYICWHAAIEIILAIHMHVTNRRKLMKKEEIAMQSVMDPVHEQSNQSVVQSYSLFRTTLGVLHLIGVVGCAIALSVQIGIS